MTREECEWNPALKKPACSPPLGGECQNMATLDLGRGRWHLCATCAALPEFKRFKQRPLHYEAAR
jgi:hypothetical protein